MLIGEYDYEMDMREKQEEVREELEEIIAKAKAETEQAKAEIEQAKAEAEQAKAKAAEREKQLLCSLVQNGRLSIREAAEEMGVSEETFLKWME